MSECECAICGDIYQSEDMAIINKVGVVCMVCVLNGNVKTEKRVNRMPRRHLKFVDCEDYTEVRNKKERLGEIEWDTDWKCFVFVPDDGMQFSASCMAELVDFIEKVLALPGLKGGK